MRLKSDFLIGGLIFSLALFIFWFSPVQGMTDSRYSMLVSQSLLDHRSFALDNYTITRSLPNQQLSWGLGRDFYQLEVRDHHLYYFYPPGGSVLSVPFVAVMNLFGVSAANADGTYNAAGEATIQKNIAALLMAALASLFFFTGRLVLPVSWSVLIALAGAFGTQVWSTASRVLWTHTWEILLLGLVVFLLLRQETGRRRAHPIALASLLAWMYFVRPTSAVTVVAVTVYMFTCYRKQFIAYAATGAAWLAGFIAYSWHHFGQLVPDYYHMATALNFNKFWAAIAVHLVSPSRGLIIYVPVLIFVIYLLVRYREGLIFPRLVVLAAAVIAGHLVVISMFPNWGGGCYGPRFTTSVVPWFVLLGIVAIKSMLAWRQRWATEEHWLSRSLTPMLGSVLVALSVFINARGAISDETWKWNAWPINIDEQPERVWDWRYPQFLAGLLPPPLPPKFPTVKRSTRIDFATGEADAFLWYGWSGPETPFRWSDGNEATVIFGLNEIADTALRMKMGPLLLPGKVTEQKVVFNLNGQRITTLTLSAPESKIYSIVLPGALLRDENILRLELPDAASLQALGMGGDSRLLGVSVEWMEFQSPASEQ